MTIVLTAIWGFLRPLLVKYWMQVSSALIIGILMLTIHFKNDNIANLNKKIIVITTELSQAKTELQTCQNNINLQNSAINVAAQKTQDDQKQMNDLSNIINVLKQQQNKTLQQIKNQPVPKTCADATTFLSTGIKDLTW